MAMVQDLTSLPDPESTERSQGMAGNASLIAWLCYNNHLVETPGIHAAMEPADRAIRSNAFISYVPRSEWLNATNSFLEVCLMLQQSL